MALLINDIIDAVSPYGSDPDLDTFTALAVQRINRQAFGEDANAATAYLACHLMAIRDRAKASGTTGSVAGGTGGSVASIKEADLTISYNKSASTGSKDSGGGVSGYDSTEYGQQYLALRRTAVTTPIIGGSG